MQHNVHSGSRQACDSPAAGERKCLASGMVRKSPGRVFRSSPPSELAAKGLGGELSRRKLRFRKAL